MTGSSPLTTRGVTITALLLALGQPAWWLLALAGFLARGGILVFVLAIVSLPSPLALSNILGPLVTPLAFGTLLPQTAALIGVAIGGFVLWLIGGGLFAAATEIALIRAAREAAAEEGMPVASDVPAGPRLVARAAVVHLAAHVPTALAVWIASLAIIRVIYAELTNPSDSGPIALRVIAGGLGPIVAIVVVWVLGETVGGLAARRLAIHGASVLGAMAGAVGDLVRRPIGALLVPVLTLVVLAIDLAAVLAIVSIVLGEVRDRLSGGIADPVATALTLATLGAAWSLALIVTGLIAAWRSAALTFEVERGGAASQPADGTNGASTHRRPGDRSVGDASGSL